jgi:hypothetical protein
MESHPNAGAMGVKMIDGKRKFSSGIEKRVPHPNGFFLENIGLTSLFHAPVFLADTTLDICFRPIHTIDILPGASCSSARKFWKKPDFYDEEFFMNGDRH